MKNRQRSRIKIVEAQLRDLRAEHEDTRREIREISRKLEDYKVQAERELAAIKAESEAMDRVSKKWLAAAAVLVALISAVIEYLKHS